MTSKYANTSGKLLIGCYVDYKPKEEQEKESYQITCAGGVHSYMKVGFAYEDSTEVLMRKTYEKLESVREAIV